MTRTETRLRAAEKLLIHGITIRELSAELSCCDKTARRIVAKLRRLGAVVQSDYVEGTQEPAQLRIKRGTRVFR
jgi:transposase